MGESSRAFSGHPEAMGDDERGVKPGGKRSDLSFKRSLWLLRAYTMRSKSVSR